MSKITEISIIGRSGIFRELFRKAAEVFTFLFGAGAALIAPAWQAMTAVTRRRSKLSGRSLEQVRAAQRFFDPSRAGAQTVQAYDCAVVV